MILKSYETKKININLNKIVLFYGQNEGFKYRKKVGKDTSDFKGIKMVGRARIEGLSEFKKINSIGVALKI